MGIKEKELEDLVLNLLDTSPAIQRKIRGICSTDQESTTMSAPTTSLSADSKAGFFDKRKIFTLESTIEQLKSQISQYQSEYRQATSKIQEYKNFSAQLQSKCNSLETDKSSLESKVSRLESDLKKAKAEQETSEQRFGALEHENSRLKEAEHSLASKLEEFDKKISILKQRFSNPVILLDRYKSLPASIRTGLSDVICDKDEVLFIASCSTSEHLKAIWTYTKKLAGSNGDANSVEVLKEIFDYFFDVFNRSLREPMYVRDIVEVGYSFDDDKYDRCAGSSTSGKITQVILKGYKSVNTGAIICRSLVRV